MSGPQHLPFHISHKVRFEGATSSLQPMNLLTTCAIAVVVLAIACIMYSFIITAIDKATHAKLHAPTTDRRRMRRKAVGHRGRRLGASRTLLSLLTKSYIIASDAKFLYARQRDPLKVHRFTKQERIKFGISTKKEREEELPDAR